MQQSKHAAKQVQSAATAITYMLSPLLTSAQLCGDAQPRLVFTDVPRSHSKILLRCFDTLGQGLHPGDSGVRGDAMHLLANHTDHLPSGHPLAKACSDALAAALKV